MTVNTFYLEGDEQEKQGYVNQHGLSRKVRRNNWVSAHLHTALHISMSSSLSSAQLAAVSTGGRRFIRFEVKILPKEVF